MQEIGAKLFFFLLPHGYLAYDHSEDTKGVIKRP